MSGDNNDNETKQLPLPNQPAGLQKPGIEKQCWQREDAESSRGRKTVPSKAKRKVVHTGSEPGPAGSQGSIPRGRAQLRPAMKLAHSKCELLLLLLLNKKDVLEMMIIGLPIHEKEGFTFFHTIILSDSSITMLMC